jgi:hypothetical protein
LKLITHYSGLILGFLREKDILEEDGEEHKKKIKLVVTFIIYHDFFYLLYLYFSFLHVRVELG